MENIIDKSVLASRLKYRQEDLRGPFFRDQTAIIHSTAFRRLKHKTQVFFAPENDHICTRIEHVLHVATIAEALCKGLNNAGWNLNGEVAYAAGIGHDLGHAPFGHSGERGINECLSYKFMHEVNSLRVVDILANKGKGLNLTFAVRDGILCHCGESFEQYLVPDTSILNLNEKLHAKRIPATWEGCAVRFADKIAYLGRDIEDALLAKIITIDDVPSQIRQELGNTNGRIINTLVIDLIENTAKHNKMGFSDEKYKLFKTLSKFNYQNIYHEADKTTYEKNCVDIVKHLFKHLKDNYDKIVNGSDNKTVFEDTFKNHVNTMKHIYTDDDKTIAITDYISGMTDNYAIASFKEITLPKPIAFGK